ncbi:GrpB family protein [Erwinia sp. CPCC 100877]|nr:GrpB family protein [Erwinia sp. CPCC 100877]
MTRKVEVITYSEKWQQQFEQEKQLLQVLFAKELVAVHHIGSTAIQQISAKPIIDILVVVTDIEQVENYNEEMRKLGYMDFGENGIAGRRFLAKGGERRSHHVHVFEKNHPEIDRHLAFRDYLNDHPEQAQAYSQLKKQLAQQFPLDIEKYMSGKDHLIKEIDRKAAEWQQQNTVKGE